MLIQIGLAFIIVDQVTQDTKTIMGGQIHPKGPQQDIGPRYIPEAGLWGSHNWGISCAPVVKTIEGIN